ncbi:hypothetical protein [Acidocella sp.]|uniref:hypothetical protein n=1 Tax=Acidocella sp. TaxID=50710 RepID=UPI00261EB755|nr:hypothetical protein [Acidocella sp.]
MNLTRRGFAAGLVMLAPGTAPAASLPATSPFITAVLRRMAALPDGPVLLNSYLVEHGAGAGDFDLTQANAAYVYDNALAGLMLLAAGQRAAAARIGQALALAQAHDRKFSDGRLRNAYAAGAMTIPAKLPGFWDMKAGRWAEDPYQLGTDTGPMAWAILLWTALGMPAPANTAADFLTTRLRAPRGYYGGFYGFDPAQQMLRWQSTEQNTDLVAAFRALGRPQDAAHAAAFVQAMHQPGTQRFNAGLAPDGAVNPMLAADAGIWPYLAGLGDAASALAAITALRRGDGIGFSAASTGIWLEGTAFASLALRKMGNRLAETFTATLHRNISPQGYVYATVAPMLATGLTIGPALQPGQPEQSFNYYRRPALSPTCWAGLAALGANPLSA